MSGLDEYLCLETERCLPFSLRASERLWGDGCVRFAALIPSFQLNPYENRSIAAASDNSYNIDQLILRHAVTNHLWCQTAFPLTAWWFRGLSRLVKCITQWILCFSDSIQYTVYTALNLLKPHTHQWVQVVKCWFHWGVLARNERNTPDGRALIVSQCLSSGVHRVTSDLSGWRWR